MFNTTLSLLIIIYLIGHIVISANSMQFAFILPWQLTSYTNWTSTSRVRASRTSDLGKIFEFIRSPTKLPFLSMFDLICKIWHVCLLLCYICTFSAVSLLYITHESWCGTINTSLTAGKRPTSIIIILRKNLPNCVCLVVFTRFK